jgi:hypothetical protein
MQARFYAGWLTHGLILFALLQLSGCVTAYLVNQPPATKVAYTFELVDDSGKPVPYASVWSVVLGFPDGSPENATGNWLQMADLQRITAHYGQSHDIVFSGDTPMNGIWDVAMTDGQGHGVFNSFFGDYLATNTQRFAFIKRGYRPAYAEFTRKPLGASTAHLKVVLTRDHQEESSATAEAFDRLRYEVNIKRESVESMDAKLNAEFEAQSRQLDALVNQALSEGNRDLAARILWFRAFMPTVRIFNGDIVGFSKDGYDLPGRKEMRLKALSLAEHEPNLMYEYAIESRRGTGVNDYEARSKVIEQYKEQLWPRYIRAYIYSTVMHNKYNDACDLANWLDWYEPQNKRLSGDIDKTYEEDDTAIEIINDDIQLEHRLHGAPIANICQRQRPKGD